MILWILLAILAVIIAIVLICLIRTVTVKPTEALNARVKKPDEKRSQAYGQSLSKLVQIETISSRFNEDRSKFYKFHEEL